MTEKKEVEELLQDYEETFQTADENIFNGKYVSIKIPKGIEWIRVSKKDLVYNDRAIYILLDSKDNNCYHIGSTQHLKNRLDSKNKKYMNLFDTVLYLEFPLSENYCLYWDFTILSFMLKHQVKQRGVKWLL